MVPLLEYFDSLRVTRRFGDQACHAQKPAAETMKIVWLLCTKPLSGLTIG